MASSQAPEAAESSANLPRTPQSFTGSPASSPSRATLPRSLSQQDRINDILTNARRRSVALAQSTTMSSIHSSPSPLHETESDADETTIFVRGRTKNYQSMAGNAQASSTPQLSSATRNGVDEIAQSRTGNDHQNNGNGNGNGNEIEDHDESWMKKTLAKYGSIELENKGSVARDHLALERTFLAWLRTSLAFASIGIAITQLFRLNTASIPSDNADAYIHLRQLGKPLGATFLGISIVVLWVGFNRYFESQHWIIRGKFPASRGSVIAVSMIAATLMVVSLVVILIVEPKAYEK